MRYGWFGNIRVNCYCSSRQYHTITAGSIEEDWHRARHVTGTRSIIRVVYVVIRAANGVRRNMVSMIGYWHRSAIPERIISLMKSAVEYSGIGMSRHHE